MMTYLMYQGDVRSLLLYVVTSSRMCKAKIDRNYNRETDTLSNWQNKQKNNCKGVIILSNIINKLPCLLLAITEDNVLQSFPAFSGEIRL